MTPSDLLFTLIDRGVRLQVVEDRLVYTAPRGTMTAELLERLRDLKAEVVGLVARRMCATCGSAGRCERRVPMSDGGWACQAALNAGLLSDVASKEAHGLRDRVQIVHVGQVVVGPKRGDETAATAPADDHADDAGAGCGESVQVRTAAGLAWVRCTGRETCDGVCARAGRDMDAAS